MCAVIFMGKVESGMKKKKKTFADRHDSFLLWAELSVMLSEIC
jgi:hypothetical protein